MVNLIDLKGISIYSENWRDIMNNTIEHIYKQYRTLRDYIVANWNEEHQLPLSNSEWICLNAVVEGAHSIPEIMKRNETSKQAAHKTVKNLVDKNLLQMTLKNNSKVRYEISMTTFGFDIYTKSLQVQQHLEQQIEQNLGIEDYERLQSILMKKWI